MLRQAPGQSVVNIVMVMIHKSVYALPGVDLCNCQICLCWDMDCLSEIAEVSHYLVGLDPPICKVPQLTRGLSVAVGSLASVRRVPSLRKWDLPIIFPKTSFLTIGARCRRHSLIYVLSEVEIFGLYYSFFYGGSIY